MTDEREAYTDVDAEMDVGRILVTLTGAWEKGHEGREINIETWRHIAATLLSKLDVFKRDAGSPSPGHRHVLSCIGKATARGEQ